MRIFLMVVLMRLSSSMLFVFPCWNEPPCSFRGCSIVLSKVLLAWSLVAPCGVARVALVVMCACCNVMPGCRVPVCGSTLADALVVVMCWSLSCCRLVVTVAIVLCAPLPCSGFVVLLSLALSCRSVVPAVHGPLPCCVVVAPLCRCCSVVFCCGVVLCGSPPCCVVVAPLCRCCSVVFCCGVVLCGSPPCCVVVLWRSLPC